MGDTPVTVTLTVLWEKGVGHKCIVNFSFSPLRCMTNQCKSDEKCHTTQHTKIHPTNHKDNEVFVSSFLNLY